ncbi:hypothetical protein Tdes44962_MAKER08446 [Teratosphaeria destructans]|uniref:Ubiquitin-like protease family profile domain-containing protein n=1 Tax=Teratosphaeria destructans TaxID=418781 RepID=A0A9W7W4H2_9PEZI|nr:hypothetical protein Tdes44962_MAKER08446 [Teratosphaeria destructans]
MKLRRKRTASQKPAAASPAELPKEVSDDLRTLVQKLNQSYSNTPRLADFISITSDLRLLPDPRLKSIASVFDYHVLDAISWQLTQAAKAQRGKPKALADIAKLAGSPAHVCADLGDLSHSCLKDIRNLVRSGFTYPQITSAWRNAYRQVVPGRTGRQSNKYPGLVLKAVQTALGAESSPKRRPATRSRSLLASTASTSASESESESGPASAASASESESESGSESAASASESESGSESVASASESESESGSESAASAATLSRAKQDHSQHTSLQSTAFSETRRASCSASSTPSPPGNALHTSRGSLHAQSPLRSIEKPRHASLALIDESDYQAHSLVLEEERDAHDHDHDHDHADSEWAGPGERVLEDSDLQPDCSQPDFSQPDFSIDQSMPTGMPHDDSPATAPHLQSPSPSAKGSMSALTSSVNERASLPCDQPIERDTIYPQTPTPSVKAVTSTAATSIEQCSVNRQAEDVPMSQHAAVRSTWSMSVDPAPNLTFRRARSEESEPSTKRRKLSSIPEYPSIYDLIPAAKPSEDRPARRGYTDHDRSLIEEKLSTLDDKAWVSSDILEVILPIFNPSPAKIWVAPWISLPDQQYHRHKTRRLTPAHHMIIVPVFGPTPNHWMLAWVKLDNIRVTEARLFDPYHIDRAAQCQTLLWSFLQSINAEVSDARLEMDNHPLEQKNAFDCGIFIAIRAICMMTSQPCPENDSGVSYWRYFFRLLCQHRYDIHHLLHAPFVDPPKHDSGIRHIDTTDLHAAMSQIAAAAQKQREQQQERATLLKQLATTCDLVRACITSARDHYSEIRRSAEKAIQDARGRLIEGGYNKAEAAWAIPDIRPLPPQAVEQALTSTAAVVVMDMQVYEAQATRLDYTILEGIKAEEAIGQKMQLDALQAQKKVADQGR